MEFKSFARLGCGLLVGALSLNCHLIFAADFGFKMMDSETPDGLSEEMAASLEQKAYVITKGVKPVFRFWFNKSIPLSSKPESAEKGLDGFIQPSLIGAIEVPEEQRDYRDDELFKDVFTIRYGIRPDDGNHLGTSDYRHFGVLIPAKKDQKIKGIEGYKPLVKASSFDTISDHPVILSLRPVSGAKGEVPSLVEPVSHHHALRVQLNGKVDGSDEKIPIVFDIVFDGFAEF